VGVVAFDSGDAAALVGGGVGMRRAGHFRLEAGEGKFVVVEFAEEGGHFWDVFFTCWSPGERQNDGFCAMSILEGARR